MTAQPAAMDAFDRWTTVGDAVRAITKRLRMLASLVDYLPALSDDGLWATWHPGNMVGDVFTDRLTSGHSLQRVEDQFAALAAE
ncbi:MAG TPA: hypothetical protein VFS59_14065 [Gemmatimonadaceae bacterium]|nr:hypothetical protein [Gemmatimonadaceae bacterium]